MVLYKGIYELLTGDRDVKCRDVSDLYKDPDGCKTRERLRWVAGGACTIFRVGDRAKLCVLLL